MCLHGTAFTWPFASHFEHHYSLVWKYPLCNALYAAKELVRKEIGSLLCNGMKTRTGSSEIDTPFSCLSLFMKQSIIVYQHGIVYERAMIISLTALQRSFKWILRKWQIFPIPISALLPIWHFSVNDQKPPPLLNTSPPPSSTLTHPRPKPPLIVPSSRSNPPGDSSQGLLP